MAYLHNLFQRRRPTTVLRYGSIKVLLILVLVLLFGHFGSGHETLGYSGASILSVQSPPASVSPGVTGDETDSVGLVTIGLGVRTSDSSFFIIRSYDTHSGNLVSEDEFELIIEEEFSPQVNSGAGRVYAVGSGLNAEGEISLLVRAYEALTGTLLWQDELTPSLESEDSAPIFRATHRPILTSGSFDLQPSSNSKTFFLVKAFNTQTGMVLWEDEFLADDGSQDNHGRSFKLNELQQVIGSFSILVRTYETKTGSLLWEDELTIGEAVIKKQDNGANFDHVDPEIDSGFTRLMVGNQR